MSASTSKKVVVYRFDREPVAGFVNPASWLGPESIEVLTPSGAVTLLPYRDIKLVCFVKEFDREGWSSERRRFASRPKSEGLWVRALFRDNDLVEGVLANELLQLESQGFLIVPPDATSNNQRVFLPKTALREFKVVGVVGSPGRARKAGTSEDQISLFE